MSLKCAIGFEMTAGNLFYEDTPLGDWRADGEADTNCTLGAKYLFAIPHITVSSFQDEMCNSLALML
jgi:hypothetical protein